VIVVDAVAGQQIKDVPLVEGGPAQLHPFDQQLRQLPPAAGFGPGQAAFLAQPPQVGTHESAHGCGGVAAPVALG
jgi:hypothetical protein